MGLFRKLFSGTRLDGMELALSAERRDYAQIDLLARFTVPRPLDDEKMQARWSRALPHPYDETIVRLVRQGWLEQDGDMYVLTAAAQPFVTAYRARLEQGKVRAMAGVRRAIAEQDCGEALDIRRQYEASHPLGTADWSGPDPQLSRSSLTRRILFLDHWLLDGLSPESAEWLKLYAAEQHLWEAYWQVDPAEIPASVQADLAVPGLDIGAAVYWRAYQLALYVDNQETWQRCKGGDHVRRIEMVGPDDDHTCAVCREFLGQQFLVARVPALPPRACTSLLGCRCRYEPVLESYDELDA